MDDWREAFVAMSVALGASADSLTGPIDSPLIEQLRIGDKAARAQALARTLATIVVSIESLEVEVAS